MRLSSFRCKGVNDVESQRKKDELLNIKGNDVYHFEINDLCEGAANSSISSTQEIISFRDTTVDATNIDSSQRKGN